MTRAAAAASRDAPVSEVRFGAARLAGPCFGVVLEEGRIKAFGAGLLSSVTELERLDASRLVPWSVEAAAATPYDPTTYQPRYFVAPSVERLLDDVLRWAAVRRGLRA